MKAPPLNRVDVTRYRYGDPGIRWLLSCGYVFETTRTRIYLVRSL